MNKFDNIIKGKLDSVEPAYDASAWSALESKMDAQAPAAQQPASNGFYSGIVGGAIAAGILTAAMVAAPSLSDHEPEQAKPVVVTTEDKAVKFDETPEEEPRKQIAAQEVHEIKLVEIQNGPKKLKDIIKEETETSEQTDDHVDDQHNEMFNGQQSGESGPTVPEPIEYTISAKGIQCPGSSIQFNVEGITENHTVQWLFDGFIPKEGASVYHSFERAGTHEAYVMVREKRDGGASTDKTMTIEIFEKPTSTIDIALEPSDKCFSQTVTATAEPSSNVYSWSIGQGPSREGESLEFNAMAGDYLIRTEVTNPEGCVSKEVNRVEVVPSFTIWSATAFTPDGNEKNDEWFPVGLDREGMTFTLEIYRSLDNSLVYKTTEIAPWDGTLKDGRSQPRSGEFFSWKLIAVDDCGNTFKDEGIFQPVR